MSDIFASFYWLWGFLRENLKLKKKLFFGTCGRIKKLYAQKKIFSKKNPNMKFGIIYILVQILFFWGTASGRFSKCFFSNFLSSEPWWPTFLLSPPIVIMITIYISLSYLTKAGARQSSNGVEFLTDFLGATSSEYFESKFELSVLLTYLKLKNI